MTEAEPVVAGVVEETKVEPKAEPTAGAAQGENSEADAKKSEKLGKTKVRGKGAKKKIDGHRLNVKNLPVETTSEELKKFFEPFGSVAAAEVKFKDDGKSRCFGFVIFSSEDDSKKATAEMNDKEVEGKKLSVGPAERREDDGKGKGKGTRNNAPSGPFGVGNGFRLNVKNMYGTVTAEKLKEIFSPFGEVLDAQVKLKENGKSAGFGFVVLPTEESGAKAVAEMHEKVVEGKKLNVAPAERRPEEDSMFYPPGIGSGKMSKKERDEMAAYMQQMMFMQQQAMMMAWSASVEYEGVLTQLTPAARHQKGKKEEGLAKGDGFISCDETFAIYGINIYADRTVLPKEAEVSSKLKFTVVAHWGEHPKAATAKLVEPAA